ncbi:protein of unknown function [Azospirillum baldaniorum]|uniref:Uncharacterized protein n=1 Tax=Azospirillum baldaniorum TaxID=1064539 RepID=A0A9P1JQ10_9PROT|nr:protein of unknown function [Azospirillum baldaniorum]
MILQNKCAQLQCASLVLLFFEQLEKLK